MNKLKPLSQSLLSASQLQRIATQTMIITQPLVESDPFIKKQHEELTESSNNIDKIYAYSSINKKTEELLEADDMMDNIITGIRDYLKGLISLHLFEPAKASAAETILEHMDSYGPKLFYGGYEKQAALIPAFVKSVKDEEFAPMLTTAGIAHLIDGLDLSSQKVIRLYQEKLQASQRPDSTMAEEKKILRYRINGLLSYLDVNIVDQVDAFVPMETPLNELITDVMGQLRAKQTRKEKSETEVINN